VLAIALVAVGRAPVLSTSLADECYRRAREARLSAEMSSMPSQKTHFLDLEKRWLRAAESVAPNILRTEPTTARPPITFPKEADVEQRLRVTRGEDAACKRPGMSKD
jgi:hypothetical protein